MYYFAGTTKKVSILAACITLTVIIGYAAAQPIQEPMDTPAQLKLEQKLRDERIKEQAAREKARAKMEEQIAKLNLPADTSPRVQAKEITINGNTLIPTEQLLRNVPAYYNASDKPLAEAASQDIYDLRVFQDIAAQPGASREVSTKAIKGFTLYLLSVYQAKHYGGIYIYVAPSAFDASGKLPNEVLPITVLEAPVSEVTAAHYDPNNRKVEKGYLRDSAILGWSPVQAGKVINRKQLDEYVNLLNINPDRYVSAVVSKGTEPNALAVGYNIYEANPWHWFVQVDNSGTDDRKWAPKVGAVNTNLLGIDDTFTALYQGRWDSSIDKNYAMYGSYDFPLAGPRLRLMLFGGYSQFNVTSLTSDIGFIGNGNFYGGTLRYNMFQVNKWFFDVTGTLSHERSKITPSLFPEFLRSDVDMDLLEYGIDVHHRDDISDSYLRLNRLDSIGGSDAHQFSLARTNAEPDFTIYTLSANHSQYLEDTKIQRLAGSLKWIVPQDRLVPAKMTIFGGMYSVRGYHEDEIIADGGVLASLQYEYDLVAREKAMNRSSQQAQENPRKKAFLRRLAPLAFIDYGLAKTKDPLPTEDAHQELCSIGAGLLVELGDHVDGAIYYGHPLVATENTKVGDGRVNVGLLVRW